MPIACRVNPRKRCRSSSIKGEVLGEPLRRQGFAEPEGQNLVGLFSLAHHQSSACTLATLSSCCR